jgi:hypothetical protein
MTRYVLPAIVLLGLVVRLPFWVEALRTPVDGDTAVIGLMAGHPFSSTTMWGQPYGSPVEAWLAAPVLAILGATPAALRLVYFLLGLALIPAAAWLAAGLDRRAAVPAALLVACPSPYFLLLASLPAPLYPTALLLSALFLGAALRLAAPVDEGRTRSVAALAGLGVLGGLAVWTHLMTATVVAAGAVHLARHTASRRALVPAALGFLAASAPLWVRALVEPGAFRVVSISARNEGMLEHLRTVLPELHRPLLGLLGAHVPWVPDDPQHVVFAPTGTAIALVALHGFMLLIAFRAGGSRGGAGLLFASVALSIAAFPFPVRASGTSIRFLSAAYLPIVALLCWAAVTKGNVRRAVIVVLTLASLNMAVALRLLDAWRHADRAEAPFHLPDLEPLRAELEAHGIRRAYAPYVTAYRLTFESRERVVASQPWNERFLHHPLPYLDDVRFARHVAWVLQPKAPTDLPAPAVFEEQLRAADGRWERRDAGRFVVFHGFAPPFGPMVRPLETAGAAGDARLETTLPITSAVTWTLSPPRPLAAVTLVAGLDRGSLPRGLDLEVSADGNTFERVVRRRPREERRDLRWVNGHPQYVIDDDMVAAPLGGRTVAALRLTPVGGDAGALAEVLAHDANPAESRGLWDEWLDPYLDWEARRRTLRGSPRPDRADWYYRRLLAERHR